MTSGKTSSEVSFPLEKRMEDLQILADIEISSRNLSGGCGLRSVISKSLSNTNEQLWNPLPYHFQPSEIGSRICSQIAIYSDDTLETYEKLLKRDPTNSFIHSRLLKIISENTEITHRASAIRSKFYLKYLATFGHDCLKSPFDILFFKESDSLWVSDPVLGKIVQFDIHGRPLQEIHMGLKGPMGLFNNNGKIGVCDFHGCRIVFIDQYSHITDEIPIRTLVKNHTPFIHPRFGICFGNYLILLLMDSFSQERSMVAMQMSGRGMRETIFLSLGVNIPIGLEVKDKNFYVGNFDPPQIYQTSSLNGTLSPCIKQYIPGQIRRFVMTADAFYISTGSYIVKISSKGEIDYVFNLKKFFHTNRVLARGLEIVDQGESHMLFIADEFRPSIHCFSICPPSDVFT